MKTKTNDVLVGIAFAAIVAGGVYYFFRVWKPRLQGRPSFTGTNPINYGYTEGSL